MDESKIVKISSGSFIDKKTSEKLFELGNFPTAITNPSEKYEIPEWDDRSITLEIPCNLGSVKYLLGIDESRMPDAYDVQFIRFAQRRKHKKKRINKKWLKKYGYKPVTETVKGIGLKSNSEGTFELVKKGY